MHDVLNFVNNLKIDKNNYRLGIKLYIYKNHEYQILTIPNNVNKKTMNYITTFLNEKFLSYNDTSKQISIINGNKDLTNLLEYVSEKDDDALTNYLKKHYNDEYKGEYIELIYNTNDNYITPFKYTIKDIESGNYKIIPIVDVVNGFEIVEVDNFIKEKIKNGRILENRYKSDKIMFVDSKKSVLALYKVYEKDKNRVKPIKVL